VVGRDDEQSAIRSHESSTTTSCKRFNECLRPFGSLSQESSPRLVGDCLDAHD